MLLWNLINSVLGLVALGIAIWGVAANLRQYKLAKRQDEEAKEQKKEDEEWSAKFGLAASSLITIGKKYIATTQPQGYGYHIVFHDLELRQRIEAYLINLSSNLDMQVRSVPPEQLRLNDVRKTITDVLDAVEKVKKKHPDVATKLSIL